MPTSGPTIGNFLSTVYCQLSDNVVQIPALLLDVTGSNVTPLGLEFAGITEDGQRVIGINMGKVSRIQTV